VLAPVFIAWLIAGFGLFGSGVEPLLEFAGDPVTPGDRAESDHLLRIWAVVTAVGPAVMALLAGWLRMPKTAATFAVATVALTCLLAVQPWVSGAFIPEPQPSEPDEPNYCIERSGGDTHCPGG
jgi:hypothetical protein